MGFDYNLGLYPSCWCDFCSLFPFFPFPRSQGVWPWSNRFTLLLWLLSSFITCCETLNGCNYDYRLILVTTKALTPPPFVAWCCVCCFSGLIVPFTHLFFFALTFKVLDPQRRLAAKHLLLHFHGSRPELKAEAFTPAKEWEILLSFILINDSYLGARETR